MKCVWSLFSFLCVAPMCHAIAPEINIQYRGVLVAEPCAIPPGEEEFTLDVGAIIDKYLYAEKRTPGKRFQIRLTECDTSLGKTVKIMFQGVENSSLPGFLAIDGKSSARGIAVGLETPEGIQLPINTYGAKLALEPGSNVIPFNVYIQGEPQAIMSKNITLGDFSATATFALEYE
ncbi:exotoxin [Enterobacter sp. J49]|uniref:fimbrial protein n=1 Tax=Enterobacter sp. J49 TaxID=1903627 RepID=UPI000A38DF8C|nr:fimbrial protein [Enterobacter sp. J49]OUC37009.1 exotoxin [Enterobacter sp. J49]